MNHGVPQLALERDGSNNELRAYGYGLQRISMTTPDGAFYYHYDILGSVANLTSSTGTTEWTESYEPFGNTLTETQNDPSAPANPMKFAGEYQDATGLYNLRARGYDPAQGRFTSLDPERDTGDAPSSAYAYADDRPTVADDPTGLHTEYLNPFAVGSDDASGIVNPKRKAPRYVSPFKRMDSKNLVPGRVDQGVDYHGYGVIRAIGDAFIIHGTYDPAWYGYYIVYRLKNGPFKGKCIYVAEGIKPTRAEKTPVDAGDTIAQFGPNAAPGRSPGIETGWSAESGKAETTRAYERRKGNVPSDHNNLPEGQAFARFLHWLHVPLTTDPRYRVPNLNRGAKYI